MWKREININMVNMVFNKRENIISKTFRNTKTFKLI